MLAQSEPAERAAPQQCDRQTGPVPHASEVSDRVLRVTAESLNRLLGLAGESRVKSRWVKGFSESLLRLKRLHHDTARALDNLREALPLQALDGKAQAALAETQRRFIDCEGLLVDRLADLDQFERSSVNLSHRLYTEALACRMRPFGDVVQGLPRLVRDLSSTLGKRVKLEIFGRDDAGRSGHSRQARGTARTSAFAMPSITASNLPKSGGRPERPKRASCGSRRVTAPAIFTSSSPTMGVASTFGGCGTRVVERKLINAEAATALTEAELLEFLFLPGFTLKDRVTDISGRGVGLDVVQDMVKHVRGTVRVSSQPGGGTAFQLQLPVTLSVIRALLAEIGGEPYAFPLALIARIVKLPQRQDRAARRAPAFRARRPADRSGHARIRCWIDRTVHRAATSCRSSSLATRRQTYGIVVDRFLGERELVVQPLDPQLGKIKDIARRRAHGGRLAGADRGCRGHDPSVEQARVGRRSRARRAGGGRGAARRSASVCSSSTTR